MEKQIPGVTLDQLAIFVAVADKGSLASAARYMGRAQSAITYGLQNLELQTGAALFDRSAYRAKITPAGIALLPRARRILEDLADYLKHAHNVVSGVEPRLNIVMDIVVPKRLIVPALKDFHIAFPAVELSVVTRPMEQTYTALRAGEADIGIVIEAPFRGLMDGLERVLFNTIHTVAVAAPNHPLAQAPGPLRDRELSDHLQLMLSNGDDFLGSQDIGGFALNRWRLNDLDLRLELLLSGIGWCRMPEHTISEDLQSGRLIRLNLDSRDRSNIWPPLKVSVATVKKQKRGIAAQWLFDRLILDGEDHQVELMKKMAGE